MTDDTPQHDDAALWREMLALNPRQCPKCGRTLDAADPMRCAGCGSALELAAAPGEPYRGLWVACMIPLCFNAGLGMLLIALYARAWINKDIFWSPASNPFEKATLFWAMFCVPVTIGMFLGRKRFQRLPAGVRSWLLIALGAICSVTFVLIIAGEL